MARYCPAFLTVALALYLVATPPCLATRYLRTPQVMPAGLDHSPDPVPSAAFLEAQALLNGLVDSIFAEVDHEKAACASQSAGGPEHESENASLASENATGVSLSDTDVDAPPAVPLRLRQAPALCLYVSCTAISLLSSHGLMLSRLMPTVCEESVSHDSCEGESVCCSLK